MPQDLTDHWVGAAVMGFGPSFVRLKSGQAALAESLEQLIITLTAVAVFFRDDRDVPVEALAFDQHEEPSSALVRRQDGKRARGAEQTLTCRVELEITVHRDKMHPEATVV
jgi:hypothetical protein